MMNETETRIFHYRIDSEDKIILVSKEWMSFASENHYNIKKESLQDKLLWDFITDMETRHIYQMMVEKVRKKGVDLKVPFRCDSPDCRRFMELELSSLENNFVDFKSRILKLEFRQPIALFDPKNGTSDEHLVVCSWCKKIKVSDTQWLEVEETVKFLNLFEEKILPKLTHGICPECSAGFAATLKISG